MIDEQERYNYFMNIINYHWNQMVKREKNTFFKTKIDELKNDTNHLAFEQTTLLNQMKRMDNYNKKIVSTQNLSSIPKISFI